MSKSQTHGLWKRFTKKNWHNEVQTYWHQFWHHIWWSPKTLKMCIESVFGQFWWPSYLMSKLMSICVKLIISISFFVNFLHSPHVWLFDIWHLFDNLTSFLTTWHLFDNLTSFWHMSNRAHEQWGTWHFFDNVTYLNLNYLSPSEGYFYKYLSVQTWSFSVTMGGLNLGMATEDSTSVQSLFTMYY